MTHTWSRPASLLRAGAIMWMLGACLTVARAAHAQIIPPSGERPDRVPDAVQPCAACHGASGEGNRAMGAPRIAAQSRYYIVKQLRSFVEGTRRNPIMEEIARSLSPQDMVTVAEYFSRTNAPPRPGVSAGALHERGRMLSDHGSRERGVPACINCHGPAGIGEPPAVPYLAGLDAGYITSAMLAWQAGTRRNDAGRQMDVIAKALTADDIDAVARYYASQPPPAPAPGARVSMPGSAASDVIRGDARRGRAVLSSGTHGCAACHTIPGVRGARGIVGPSLESIGRRPLIAGRLPNRPGVLGAFILNPPALVPETGMPNVGLTARDARDIAAYLNTLH